MSARKPEEIMGYMPRRRWDDKLLRVRLLVRGTLFLILLALVAWLLPASAPQMPPAVLDVPPGATYRCARQGDVVVCTITKGVLK